MRPRRSVFIRDNYVFIFVCWNWSISLSIISLKNNSRRLNEPRRQRTRRRTSRRVSVPMTVSIWTHPMMPTITKPIKHSVRIRCSISHSHQLDRTMSVHSPTHRRFDRLRGRVGLDLLVERIWSVSVEPWLPFPSRCLRRRFSTLLTRSSSIDHIHPTWDRLVWLWRKVEAIPVPTNNRQGQCTLLIFATDRLHLSFTVIVRRSVQAKQFTFKYIPMIHERRCSPHLSARR